MKAIDRLFEYIEYKDIRYTRLEKEIGLSNGYLNTQRKRKADLGEGVLVKIIDYCLDVNPEWLLLGKGKMIKEDSIASTESMQDSFLRRFEELSRENERLKIEIEQMKSNPGEGPGIDDDFFNKEEMKLVEKAKKDL